MHSDSMSALKPTMTAEEFEATLGGLVTEFASLPKVEHDPRLIDFDPPPPIRQPAIPRKKWVLPVAAMACTLLGAGLAFGIFAYLSVAQPQTLKPTPIAIHADAKETKAKAKTPVVVEKTTATAEAKAGTSATNNAAASTPPAPKDRETKNSGIQDNETIAATPPQEKKAAKKKAKKARRRRLAKHRLRAKHRRTKARRHRARRVASANDDWVDPFK